VNGGVEDRAAQMLLTADFIAQILKKDKNAKIISSGDYTEFAFGEPIETFKKVSGLLDLDEVADIPTLERYTYLFDMNCQQIDHVFVSKAIASKKAEFEHLHVNTWATYDDQISDHDPSVARLNVCQ
jgi:predicted extracellular nuclease